MAQRVTTMTNYKTVQYIDKVNAEQLAAIDRLLEFLPPYVESYSNYKKSKVSTKTRREYIQDLFSFFSFLCDMHPKCQGLIIREIPLDLLSSLTLDDFSNYENWLTDETKGGGANSQVTIKRKTSSLRSFFKYLYAADMIAINTVAKIETAKTNAKDPEEIRVLSDAERTVFLARFDTMYEQAADKLAKQMADAEKKGKELSQTAKIKPALVKRDKAIVYLILGSGLRVSELCAINVTNVVSDLSRINVTRKGEKTDINKSTTDYVLLNEGVMNVLMEYLTEYRDIIGPDINNYDALFLSSKHTRITPRAIEQMVREYADTTLGAGNQVRVHTLRASFGQRYQDTFGDIFATAKVMHHSSTDVTAKHYIKVSEKAKENAMKIPVI